MSMRCQTDPVVVVPPPNGRVIQVSPRGPVVIVPEPKARVWNACPDGVVAGDSKTPASESRHSRRHGRIKNS